jgi:hypothetical protein
MTGSALRTLLLVMVLACVLGACGDGGTVTLADDSSGGGGSGIESVLAFALILVPLFRGMRDVEDDAQ